MDSSDEYFHMEAIKYMQPYLQQMFPNSVRAIKEAIASNENMSSVDAMQVEKDMFKLRWCSDDNKAALHSSAVHFFKRG